MSTMKVLALPILFALNKATTSDNPYVCGEDTCAQFPCAINYRGQFAGEFFCSVNNRHEYCVSSGHDGLTSLFNSCGAYLEYDPELKACNWPGRANADACQYGNEVAAGASTIPLTDTTTEVTTGTTVAATEVSTTLASTTTTEETTVPVTTGTTTASTTTAASTSESTTVSTTAETTTTTISTTTTTLEETCNGQVIDLILLMDGSSSATAENFIDEINFFKAVTASLNVSPATTRVAMAQFANFPRTEFQFIDDQLALENAFDSVTQITGATFTGQAIQHVTDEIVPNLRPEAVPVLLLLTDGTSFDQVKEPSDHLRDSFGFQIFAVGVHAATSFQLYEIANAPVEHFVWNDAYWQSLATVAQELPGRVLDTSETECDQYPLTPTTPAPTTTTTL